MKNNLLFLLLVLASCAPATVSSLSNGTKGKYKEDLSVYRPNLNLKEESQNNNNITDEQIIAQPIIIEHEVTDTLNLKLDSISTLRLKKNQYAGYTIQVYTGQDHAKARESQGTLLRYFPDSQPRLFYTQPNFKVQVGKYFEKFQALTLLDSIREYFPSAIILPETFEIVENK